MDEEARALLARYKTERSPSADGQARAWESVSTRIAAGDPGPPLPPERSWLRASAIGFGAGLVVASGIFGAYVAWNQPGPSEPAATMLPSVVVTVGSSRLSASGTLVQAPALAHSPPPGDEAKPATPKPRPRASDESTEPEIEPKKPKSTLADEMKILGPARSALRRGDPTRALELLEKHEHRFPRGQLSDERDFERVKCLCALDHTDRARAAAKRFAKTHPGSALASKASSLCQ